FRSPAPALVDADLSVLLQYRINHRPGCLHRILAGKECSVASHRIAQQSLIGRLLPSKVLTKKQLPLLPDELLPRELYPSGEGDGRVRREAKTHIVGAACLRSRIPKQP